MEQIREGLLAGINVYLYAIPNLTHEQMKEVKDILKSKAE